MFQVDSIVFGLLLLVVLSLLVVLVEQLKK